MGLFWRGIPSFLAIRGVEILGPDTMAIETGTYLGDTTEFLAGIFRSVTTIELDETLASRAKLRMKNHDHVQVVIGNSRSCLSTALPAKGSPLFLWLDAHYSGGVTAGEADPCPLLAEIELLNERRMPENTILLIDDARAILGREGWPTLNEICSALSRWVIVQVDDVLVCSNNSNVGNLISNYRSSSRLFMLESLAGNWKVISLCSRLTTWLGKSKVRNGLLFLTAKRFRQLFRTTDTQR